MDPIQKTPSDEISSVFEKHFGGAFRRVYAYVLARVGDHTSAQRLTRSVLIRALPELVEEREPELSAFLLQTANRLLRDEAEKRRTARD
jgi:DNA-directed RNA polymerase specialized sigma24 family protein